MGIEQNQYGVFFTKGYYETKADTAGGMDGFPVVTKAAWRKRHQEKLEREAKSGKKK